MMKCYPEHLTEIMRQAFYGCTNLTSITIPSGVTRIEYAAFIDTGLKSIKVPAGVTSFGYEDKGGEDIAWIADGETIVYIVKDSYVDKLIKELSDMGEWTPDIEYYIP